MRSLPVMLAALLVAAPSAEAAVGAGVVLDFAGRGPTATLRLRFTPRADRLLAQVRGRALTLECLRAPSRGPFGWGEESAAVSVGFAVPARGRTIDLGVGRRPPLDLCRVTWPRRTRPERLIVERALTPRGAVYGEERRAALRIGTVAAEADPSMTGSTRFEPAAALLRRLGARARRGPVGPLVALPTVDAPAPRAPAVGYWSDGLHHGLVATTTSRGRRLFLEVDGDAIASNVLGFVRGIDEG